MLSPGFENLSVDEFKQYIDTLQEKDYMLIDVRQPEEYTQAHIPGAKLIPLMELESRMVDFPTDMDMYFTAAAAHVPRQLRSWHWAVPSR